MKKLILLLCLMCACTVFSQNNEEKDINDIQAVLKAQRLAWSKNNIEEFMEGYWKSDSLKFYGSNGVTYGWENTLKRYKKAYPSKDHTGKLSFKINDISKITDDAYYVLGEFHLKREVGNASGFFMLVFKKINGEWKIIADTSA
ncbi:MULTISPECIES: YybH family protein [Aestuariibaculum]|uniref:Nuclear transport factor 2 family protein n=1 Tax=Aestuariibaculum lutulentum TaxID=2920935 RepID=A0ABS9RFN3_9FLAO|nr:MULTISPECIES: nuclear transport factor 2 family protein [Aestuariibaculum]MCH4551755.1 nuclear transport factor 2 family protein [Aestuariibaculum lutulentum]MCR8666858.1 nuclear transport factor 2 family protein [Aestuariibaculum sp. M13]